MRERLSISSASNLGNISRAARRVVSRAAELGAGAAAGVAAAAVPGLSVSAEARQCTLSSCVARPESLW